MWHFGKGQAFRLGCPSIFITSPLVIWKLASPIFVSHVAGRSSSPRCVLISSFFSHSSLSSHTFLLSFSQWCHLFPRALINTAFFFLLLTRWKLSLWGIRNPIFQAHNTNAQKPGGCVCVWGGGGSRGCMSTPAVRIVVTGRRANTNVINTSALTPGTSNVTICL